MIQTGIEKDNFFCELTPLLAPFGIQVVDAHVSRYSGGVSASITIFTADHEVHVDDCARVYNLVYPRLEMTYGTRDIKLEVSTPGVQRNLHDAYEFTIFTGRRCRVYDLRKEGWVTGFIALSDDTSVTLEKANSEDTEEDLGTYRVPFDQIQKAKLDYRWEDVATCPAT